MPKPCSPPSRPGGCPSGAWYIVGNVCAVLFFLLFPSGRFAPRWTRWLAVAFSAFQVSRILFPDVALSFAFPGDDLILGVPGHRGEPGLVPDLFFPQSLLSGTTSPDQVGRLRRDPGHRGNLPLPAAGGPRLDWRRHTYCATPPQNRLYACPFCSSHCPSP